MKFISSNGQGSQLDRLNKEAMTKCSSVDAAIAYVSDEKTLIDTCGKQKTPLRLWARYDWSAPVSIRVLRRFLDGNESHMQLRLVPDIFHPKVIWWKKFGAYIGSANLTDRAWFGNFEAGVFISEDELFDEEGIHSDLEEFFASVDEHSHAITDEIVNEIEEFSQRWLWEQQAKARKEFKATRSIKELLSLTRIDRPKGRKKAEASFLKEWNETLTLLRRIGDVVTQDENRPKWVRPEVPKGVQADQFLHAYYYDYISDGRIHPFTEFFHKNKDRKDEALQEALEWWSQLDSAPSQEDIHMNENAVEAESLLRKDRILTLNDTEFYRLCSCIHALGNHARQIKWANHGIHVDRGQTREDRTRILSDWLLEQQNGYKQTVLELIHYVLYGGSQESTPQRIFEASHDPKRKIEHFGISTIGELVGWAQPDLFPPRNGRTSKALTALGYDVKIHSK